MAEILRFQVTTEYDGVKAGRFLRGYCGLSARSLNILKRTDGGLSINGRLLRTIDILKAGDLVEIRLPSEKSEIEPVCGEIDVVYEDAYILVVNKPPSMPVHPVKKHQRDTLANIIAYRYMNSESVFVFRAVNRLDSDTSGLVMIAKDRHTASLLQNSDISKHYLAVCHGQVAESGTIDKDIILKPDSKIVRTVSSEGQRAVTHYKKVCSFSEGSVVDLSLETGRTHQIRCHMSYIGHPLYGDDLYGGERKHIIRQALHCKSMKFIHPYTKEEIYLETELPDDMEKLIDILNSK